MRAAAIHQTVEESVIVKYTYFGDTNLDGTVTSADFGRFLDGLVNHGSTWAQGDFTYDGHVDLGNDYNLFLAGYLQSGGQLGALADVVDGDSQLTVTQKASLLAAIPEPSSIAILALTGLVATRRCQCVWIFGQLEATDGIPLRITVWHDGDATVE